MHRISCALGAAVSFTLSSPAAASDRDWAKASDIGRDGLMIAALAVPALHGDLTGVGQAGLSMGVTRVVTDRLKVAVGEERPDGSNNRSFPSGHTSISFSAAASLHKRYGWKYGAPAYAVASFVGAARVKADKHYVHDVVAGAALGAGVSWLLTTRKDSNVQWLPWGDTKGAGASVSVRF